MVSKWSGPPGTFEAPYAVIRTSITSLEHPASNLTILAPAVGPDGDARDHFWLTDVVCDRCILRLDLGAPLQVVGIGAATQHGAASHICAKGLPFLPLSADDLHFAGAETEEDHKKWVLLVPPAIFATPLQHRADLMMSPLIASERRVWAPSRATHGATTTPYCRYIDVDVRGLWEPLGRVGLTALRVYVASPPPATSLPFVTSSVVPALASDAGATPLPRRAAPVALPAAALAAAASAVAGGSYQHGAAHHDISDHAVPPPGPHAAPATSSSTTPPPDSRPPSVPPVLPHVIAAMGGAPRSGAATPFDSSTPSRVAPAAADAVTPAAGHVRPARTVFGGGPMGGVGQYPSLTALGELTTSGSALTPRPDLAPDHGHADEFGASPSPTRVAPTRTVFVPTVTVAAMPAPAAPSGVAATLTAQRRRVRDEDVDASPGIAPPAGPLATQTPAMTVVRRAALSEAAPREYMTADGARPAAAAPLAVPPQQLAPLASAPSTLTSPPAPPTTTSVPAAGLAPTRSFFSPSATAVTSAVPATAMPTTTVPRAVVASTLTPGPTAPPPAGPPLRGVVAVLSGYVNPARGQVRDHIVALGGACRPDWGPGCTHLVCVASSTPKYHEVVRSGYGVIVGRNWVDACVATGRRADEAPYYVGTGGPHAVAAGAGLAGPPVGGAPPPPSAAGGGYGKFGPDGSFDFV